MSGGLLRELAPLSDRAWKRIDDEARDVLAIHLAARRIVDFEGPLGWEQSSIDLGATDALEGPGPKGARLRLRRVRPLLELRVGFALPREELERIDRGGRSVDLDPLVDAARLLAATEDTAIFEGYADADIPGLQSDSAHQGVRPPGDAGELPAAVSSALEMLREAGVGGPYALALGPAAHRALEAGRRDGYPLKKQIERLLDGPVIWAPALTGGLVASLRGGDFKLFCGRDVAVGYLGHDDREVRLYLEESFTAELVGPEAAVPLIPGEAS